MLKKIFLWTILSFFLIEKATAVSMITDIVSNPEEGRKEEVFLEGEGDLSGFFFADDNTFSKGGFFFEIPEGSIVDPEGKISFSGWGNILNNTGDTLFFFDRGKNLLQTIVIPEMEKGEICHVVGEVCEKISTEEIKDPADTLGEEPPENETEYFLRIESILSNGEEWVDIVSTGATEQDLSGITLSDRIGIFFTVPIGTKIQKEEKIRLSGWSSKLNNDGDSLFLKSPSGKTLDQREIPALQEGEICVVSDSGCLGKTGETNSSTSSEGLPPLVKTKAQTPSFWADRVDIVFSEVLFRSEEYDIIELKCQKCGVDLAGFRLGDDEAFFEFPEKSIIEDDTLIVIQLNGENTPPEKKGDVWFFSGPKKDLSATDETLFLIDSRGEIASAICIADQSGTFSPGEKNDLTVLLRQGIIQGVHPMDESICADSRPLQKEVSLVFFQNTRQPQKDSFWTTQMSFGEENPDRPMRIGEGLSIEKVFLLNEEMIILKIKNHLQKKISTSGISLSQEGETVSFPKEFFGPEEVFFWEREKISEVFLIDFWRNSSEIIKEEDFQMFHEKKGNIILSEVLPNPEGADKTKEFVELSCQTQVCDMGHFRLFIGEKEVDIGRKNLLQNEKMAIFAPMKNTTGGVSLFDLSSGTKQIFSWEKAESGKSLIEEGWTDFPTPEEENFFGKNGEDSNRDGMSDEDNFFMRGIESLFPRILERRFRLEADQQEDGGIRISGTAPPKSIIQGRIEGEKWEATSDSTGHFSLLVFPFLEKKMSIISTIAFFPDGNRVEKRVDIFPKKNPQEDWIQTLELKGVLPNPEGNDNGKEAVLLQNTGSISGWTKNFFWEIGGKKKKLPEIFLEGGEERMFTGKEIPPLKNISGALSLFRGEQKQATISWKKAISGGWYGETFPTPQVSKKMKKSSRTAKNPVSPLESEDSAEKQSIGILQERQDRVLFFWNIETQTREMALLSENFDPVGIDQLIAEKAEVIMHIGGQKILEIEKKDYFLPAEKREVVFPWLTLNIVLIIGSALILIGKQILIFRTKKKRVQILSSS